MIEKDISAVLDLDLLIDRQHDEISNVDVARQCQHVRDDIGDILRSQPWQKRFVQRAPRVCA